MKGRHARRGALSLSVTAGAAAVALAVSGVLGAPAPPAAAAPVALDQVFPAPSGGVYLLDGHGYGHGIGLSQWGAEYGASTGQGYQQILAHYYPGTKLGSDGSPRAIRVHIQEAAADQLFVQADAKLTSTDLSSGKNPQQLCAPYTSGHQITEWGVAANQGIPTTVPPTPPAQMLFAYYSGGYVHCPGTYSGPIVFSDPNNVTEVLPGNVDRTFSGTLQADTTGPSSIAVVNTVPLESYVEGVVPNESPASWPPAALEAQAVAARTYALADYQSGGNWDICDTDYCQVYRGASSEYQSSNTATADTAGQVLDYNGALITAMYSASNGGYSAAGNAPYLPAQPDPWDVGSPEHDWTARVTAAQIAALYPQIGTLTNITVTSRDGNGDWQGRVLQVNLVGSTGSVSVSGSLLSGQLGLMSNWWTVDPATYPPPPIAPPAAGYPVGVAWQPSSRFTVVGRSATGSVTAVPWTSTGGWGAPFSLGGLILGHPEEAPGPAGTPMAMAEGTNQAAYVRPVYGGHWYLVGGRLTSAPSGITWSTGQFSIFVRGADGALWGRTWSGSWGNWFSLGGVLAPGTTAAATSPGPGRISLFADGPHGVVWERDFGPGGWSGWVNLGEPVSGEPAAASGGGGGVVVLARQADGSLQAASGVPGRLGPWQSVGTGFTTDPAAAAWPAAAGTRVDAFAWAGSNLLQATWFGQSWTAWQRPF